MVYSFSCKISDLLGQEQKCHSFRINGGWCVCTEWQVLWSANCYAAGPSDQLGKKAVLD